MAGWLLVRLVARLYTHITVKNARYKLNVMCYVTECWSFKGDCTDFDLNEKRFFNASSYIGVQLIVHTHTHAQRTHTRVLLYTHTHDDA